MASTIFNCSICLENTSEGYCHLPYGASIEKKTNWIHGVCSPCFKEITQAPEFESNLKCGSCKKLWTSYITLGNNQEILTIEDISQKILKIQKNNKQIKTGEILGEIIGGIMARLLSVMPLALLQTRPLLQKDLSPLSLELVALITGKIGGIIGSSVSEEKMGLPAAKTLEGVLKRVTLGVFVGTVLGLFVPAEIVLIRTGLQLEGERTGAVIDVARAAMFGSMTGAMAGATAAIILEEKATILGGITGKKLGRFVVRTSLEGLEKLELLQARVNTAWTQKLIDGKILPTSDNFHEE